MKCHFFWYASEPIVWKHWHAVAMKSFKKFHPDIAVVLHTNQNVSLPPDWDFVDKVEVMDVLPCPAPNKQWAGPQNSADFMKGWFALHEKEPGLYSDIDFTYIRRLPDWFIKPDGNKMRAPRLYHGWRPDLSPGLFFVSGPGNKIIEEWVNWYGKDYAGNHYHFNAMYTLGFLSYRYPEAIEVPSTAEFLYKYIPTTIDWDFNKWYEESPNSCTLHWGTWLIKKQQESGLTAWHAARDFAYTGIHNPYYAYAAMKTPPEKHISISEIRKEYVYSTIDKVVESFNSHQDAKWFVFSDKNVWVNKAQLEIASFNGCEVIVPSACFGNDYFNCIILSYDAAKKFIDSKCQDSQKPMFDAIMKLKNFSQMQTNLIHSHLDETLFNPSKMVLAVRKISNKMKKKIKDSSIVQPDNTVAIPNKKKAHFIWIDKGEQQYPWYLRFAIETLRTTNPDVEIVVHTNSKMVCSFSDRVEQLDKTFISDNLYHSRILCKLDIANREGGMVFDNDVVFVKPIPNWFSQPNKFNCSKFDSTSNAPMSLNIFSSQMNNPFVSELLMTYKDYGIESDESTYLISKFFYEYPNDVNEVSPELFYPFQKGKNDGVHENIKANSFAMHMGRYYTDETTEDMLDSSNWAYPNIWRWWKEKFK